MAEQSTRDTSPGPYLVACVFEDVNPVLLGVNADTLLPSPQVNTARVLLGSLTPDPEKVVLVVTGDMVQSVRDRLPQGDADAFNDARGAGTLSGKTMPVGDQTHVLMPQWLFTDEEGVRNIHDREAADEWNAASESRKKFAARTAVHEAQHVILQRAGEDRIDYTGAPRARHTLLMVAHNVIDEYRAELGVPQDMREDFELTIAPESLQAWKESLRLSTRSYQTHHDLERLMHEVLMESQNAWKALANVAAARRVAHVSTPPAPVRLWEEMVSDLWDHFEDALTEVVPPHTRVSAGALRVPVERVADVLSSWLELLGVVWRDINGGANAEFRIESRHITG